MGAQEGMEELPLETAGLTLRRAREAAGHSLADIASATRIPERHLAAIEEGRYSDLPARTYALGFARSFARAVGLDQAAIGNAVRGELDGSEAQPSPPAAPAFTPGDPARVPSNRIVWIAILAVITAVAGGVVYWRDYYMPAASLPSLLPEPAPATATSAPATSAPAASAAAPNAATTGLAGPVPPPVASAAAATGQKPGIAAPPVVFTSMQDRIWVKFYDASGKQLLQKQLAKGESYTLPADAVGPMLWTGRPDALAITVGGHALPQLATKQTIVKNVPVSAAALLARQAATRPAANANISASAGAVAGNGSHPGASLPVTGQASGRSRSSEEPRHRPRKAHGTSPYSAKQDGGALPIATPAAAASGGSASPAGAPAATKASTVSE